MNKLSYAIVVAVALLMPAALLLGAPALEQAMAQVPNASTAVPTPGPVVTGPLVAVPVAPKSNLFDFGDLAAQIISYLVLAFGATVAAGVTAAILKLLKWLGVQNTELLRGQLQGIVVNGLNAAAAKAPEVLRGRATVELKNKIVDDAVKYAQAHGAETMKALGLDPNSGEAVDAIKARIETALNDPAAPTPPAITPPEVLPKVAPRVPAT